MLRVELASITSQGVFGDSFLRAVRRCQPNWGCAAETSRESAFEVLFFSCVWVEFWLGLKFMCFSLVNMCWLLLLPSLLVLLLLLHAFAAVAAASAVVDAAVIVVDVVVVDEDAVAAVSAVDVVVPATVCSMCAMLSSSKLEFNSIGPDAVPTFWTGPHPSKDDADDKKPHF